MSVNLFSVIFSCHHVFSPLQGKAPNEIHSILTETLEWEHAPSYVSLKHWVALFKSGDFSTYDRRLRTVTNPEIIDQNHMTILGESCSLFVNTHTYILLAYLICLLREKVK